MRRLIKPGGQYLGQRVGAGIAVLRGEQLLLIQRRDNGLWDIPGGAVNPGENVFLAAIREVTEETGIRVGSATLLDVFSGPGFQHTYPDGNTVDWATVLYLSRDVAGAARAADDAAQAAWWPLKNLPADISPATRAYFQAVQSAQTGVTS